MARITITASPLMSIAGSVSGASSASRRGAEKWRTVISATLLICIFSFSSLKVHGQTAFMSADEVEQFGGSHLFDQQGYRVDNYRSPTPVRIEGITTVDTQALDALMTSEPDLVIVDVINLTFQNDRFLIDKPHQAIVGAHWLPNTGQGDLELRWEQYLLGEVQRLTEGNNRRPVVVACKSDCWLSWNVSLRLYNAGYRSLYWYRNGVDTWMANGKPVETVEPITPVFAKSPGDKSSNNNF